MKKIFFCAFWVFGQTFLLFGQQKITFKTTKIASAKINIQHLFLAGNFNNWNPADTAWMLQLTNTGNYQLLKSLPKGVYHFKVTRGTWQTVECNAGGTATDNRTLTLLNDTTVSMDVINWQDNFPVPEKKHTASKQVQIISDQFDMPQLGRQRRVWIYLPKDYQHSGREYPVIYMQDGQNLFDSYSSGFGEWGVDEILDKLPLKEQGIIVGIDHGGDYRITEYNPYDSKYGKGRGSEYVDFLVKTLKPYIDEHYRTKKDQRHTAIAGSSMGGLISMYAALKYPATFGSAGIFSPAFWIAPEIYRFAQDQRLTTGSRFYFVCGDAESDLMVSDMKKMAATMINNGVAKQNVPVTVIKGAVHNEKQWTGDFPAFYNWLMKGWY